MNRSVVFAILLLGGCTQHSVAKISTPAVAPATTIAPSRITVKTTLPHKYEVGDCIDLNRVRERWDTDNGYTIRRIMEIGVVKYRFCYPLVETKERCDEVGNERHGTSDLEFQLMDMISHKVECPPYAK